MGDHINDYDGEYTDEVLKVFLKKQGQLFDEPVASNMEEASVFLQDCMAIVVDSVEDLREYFDEAGMDAAGMTDDELVESAEVFSLPSGGYLVVEG